MVKGSKTAVIADTSDGNCSFGRLTAFQENLGVGFHASVALFAQLSWCFVRDEKEVVPFLQHLLDEQLSKKKGLYLCHFGTDVYPLWTDVMDVNWRTWVGTNKRTKFLVVSQQEIFNPSTHVHVQTQPFFQLMQNYPCFFLFCFFLRPKKQLQPCLLRLEQVLYRMLISFTGWTKQNGGLNVCMPVEDATCWKFWEKFSSWKTLTQFSLLLAPREYCTLICDSKWTYCSLMESLSPTFLHLIFQTGPEWWSAGGFCWSAERWTGHPSPDSGLRLLQPCHQCSYTQITKVSVADMCLFSAPRQLHFCLCLQMAMRNLAESTGGRYHCYTSNSDVSFFPLFSRKRFSLILLACEEK